MNGVTSIEIEYNEPNLIVTINARLKVILLNEIGDFNFEFRDGAIEGGSHLIHIDRQVRAEVLQDGFCANLLNNHVDMLVQVHVEQKVVPDACNTFKACTELQVVE